MSALMTGPARAALYTAEGSTLMTCARHAERAGLRVVTMIDEDRPGVGLAGSRLNDLVDRLNHGEFEVIVAGAGAGRVVTIAAAAIDAGAADVGPAVDTVEDPQTPTADAAPGPAVDRAVRCAIYARCASAVQADLDPLAAQIGACEAYATDQEWEAVAVYKDIAVSGMKWSRPGLDQMMAAAQRGAFDVLLIEDLARLSRSASGLPEMIDDLKVLGVVVHTVGGGAICLMEAAFRNVMTMRSMKERPAKKRLRPDSHVDRKLRSSRDRLGQAGAAS